MRNWMLAGAVIVVASFFATPAPAQEVVTGGTKVQASTGTVVMQPQTQQRRVGLLGRLRGQRSTMVAQPMTRVETGPVSKVETIPVTPSTVKQAGVVTEPVTMVPPSQSVERRQGLLARLRLRR